MKPFSLIGVFHDREGSTTITVILSLVLACALVASCLQWYWVNTTSMDIQAVADLGALAAGEVVAQTVMVIQALDALMLTVNLFGLLLHCTVLVAGTAIAVAAPAGSEVLIEYYDKLVQFDKDFCDQRKRIAPQIKRFAEGLCAATPLLASARGAWTIEQNQALLGDHNKSRYVGIVIPTPLVGSVEMTNDPADVELWEQELRESGAQNHQSARRIRDLQDECEAAIDTCFERDVYKKPSTPRAFWHPSAALSDFRSQWSRLREQDVAPPIDPLPIDDTASTREQASQRFKDYYERMRDRLDREVTDAIGPDPTIDEPMTPSLVDLHDLMRDEWDQTVLVLDHGESERYAYHSRSDCFGLSNASKQLQEVPLRTLRSQSDHPPCTWCSPPAWKAIQVLEDDVSTFTEYWNQEVYAIWEYELLRQQIDQEVSVTQKRIADTLEEILDMASGYLMGNRLTYEPSGGRGVYCLVINASERTLPGYTLPSLTGAGDIELGTQVAIAGARLLPSMTESTLPSLVEELDIDAATTAGLGGVVRSMLGDDAAVLSFGLALWGSCLDLYGTQVAGLYQLSEGLPWGLGSMVESTMDEVFEAAQIQAPDLRRPIPTLVSIREIGAQEQDGAEGMIARVLNQGYAVLEETGGLSTFGLKEHFRAAAQELSANLTFRIEDILNPTIGGVALRLPFLEQILGEIDSYSNSGIELLYGLPDYTW